EEILRINTQDSARVWLWRVVDLAMLLVIAQLTLDLTIMGPARRLYASLALTAVFIGIVCRSYLRLDPLVRRLILRFEFGSQRSAHSQSKAKVIAALVFADAALVGTPWTFWVIDLCAFGIVAMALGRWRVRIGMALRKWWRQWTHRRALAKHVRAARP